jgi:pyridoxine 4-dehydrogenase
MYEISRCNGRRIACDSAVAAVCDRRPLIVSRLRWVSLTAMRAAVLAKPMSVALAWLLQRPPNILLIPGTSSVEHLRENVAGAGLQLPHEAIKELNAIAG